MSLAPKLILGQRQALVMTPQLQQAIKLLQLNQLELARFIEAELEQNPLLATAEESGESDVETPEIEVALPAPPATSAGDDREESAEVFDPRSDDAALSGALSGDSIEFGNGGRADGDDYDPLQAIGEEQTLRQHIQAQIGLEFADPAQRLIAVSLAGMVDAAGYIEVDIDEVAQRIGVTAAEVTAVLGRLQRFDPPGIFARSLSECLALQLAERNRLDPAMQALLDNLELVARRDFAVLMRRCGVDAEDLTQMLAELRQLDPKPGERFEAPVAQTLVPDLYLRPAPDGGWLIELNNDALPRVLVNRQYHATLVRGTRDKNAREFITEKLQIASWLVKALDQRANTILRVAREIVRQQEGFFRRGVSGLRPLVLRDIAVAVELHESTISRVTTNKFMATPRGIFELKYFFTSALPAVAASGDSVTSEAVRDRIRLLIEGEPPTGTLSDDRIVTLLHGEGVVIARRTVAKYRDALGIPSSAQRRRDKALQVMADRQQAPVGLRPAERALSAGEVDLGHS
jgi:RNA polymerase sigma-54 factor